jgi:hypothetical protein
MTTRCTISGSFRKFYEGILVAIETFENNEIKVLSPKKSEVVEEKDGFAFLKSDGTRNIKVLEDCHLQAIKNSNFLYVYNPNGYLGHTVSFEIGYAHRSVIPIFSLEHINDVTLKEYVTEVISPLDLCLKIKRDSYTF